MRRPAGALTPFVSRVFTQAQDQVRSLNTTTPSMRLPKTEYDSLNDGDKNGHTRKNPLPQNTGDMYGGVPAYKRRRSWHKWIEDDLSYSKMSSLILYL